MQPVWRRFGGIVKTRARGVRVGYVHQNVPEQALEDELIAHGASCLLVSHDRSFIRHVGNRFWWINGKRLEDVESAEAFLARELTPT